MHLFYNAQKQVESDNKDPDAGSNHKMKKQ